MDTFTVGGSGGIDAAGTKKYYTIPVQAGMRPYISATIVPPDDTVGSTDIFGVDVRLLRRDLRECARERGFDVLQGNQNKAPTAVLDGPTFDSARSSSCPTDGVGIVEITRIGRAWADRPVPVEIVVRMEPPADTAGLPPAADKGDLLPAPVHGTPTALTGGSSFNDAPRLTSATTYTDTLVTGESRYFRVPLEWGQRMSFLITEAGPPQPSLGAVGALVSVDVFNPVRQDITGVDNTSGRYWFGNSASDPFSASTDFPVRYTNRNGYIQGEFALDGDYYLRINANRSDNRPSSTSYLMTVVVSGDLEPGPTYLEPGAVPPSASNTSWTTPVTSATTAASASSTAASVVVTSGATTTDPIGVDTAASSGPIGDQAFAGWVWALGGAVVAGLVVGAVLIVQRRRRPGTHSGDGPGPYGPTWS